MADVDAGVAPAIEEDAKLTGPDEAERKAADETEDVLELPEEDEEFDEDLRELLAEIEADEREGGG